MLNLLLGGYGPRSPQDPLLVKAMEYQLYFTPSGIVLVLLHSTYKV